MKKKLLTNQKGLASIIVVSVLVVVISLISIGFSRLMNRELTQSIEDQKAQAAFYAAESGINEVIKNLKQGYSQNQTNCNNGLRNKLNSNTGLSGDKNTEYTCVLLDNDPDSLNYDLGDGQTKVIKISTSSPLVSLMLDWRSNPAGKNNFVSAGTSLYDEHSWGAAGNGGNIPMLKAVLYPLPHSGDLASAQTNSRTYFLYPGGSGSATTADYNSPGNYLQRVDCASPNLSSLSYPTPSPGYCSIVIQNLPNQNDAGSFTYLTLTPIYSSAHVDIRAKTTSGNATFTKLQAVVDVSAKSADVVKRLQARVNISNLQTRGETDSNVNYALRSASTICKRYVAPTNLDPVIDPSAAPDCVISFIKGKGLPPNPITLPATNIQSYSVDLNGTVQPNANSATYFYQYAKGIKPVPGETLTDAPAQPGYPLIISGGPTGTYNAPYTLQINLSPGDIYHFRICALNPNVANPVCDGWQAFHYTGGGGGISCVVTSPVAVYYGGGSQGPSGGGPVMNGTICVKGAKKVYYWWEYYAVDKVFLKPKSSVIQRPTQPGILLNETRGPNTSYYEQWVMTPLSVWDFNHYYYYQRMCAQAAGGSSMCGKYILQRNVP